jgi:hypothetical protein
MLVIGLSTRLGWWIWIFRGEMVAGLDDCIGA